MSLVTKYSDPRGIEEPAVLVSVGSNIRFGEFGVSMAAAAGEPATSTVELDDPGGIYDFVGLRAFDVRETSAPSNNQMIGRFIIQDREVGRSPEKSSLVGKDRIWSIDLTDYNYHLTKRVLTDSDANRPRESAGDRIRWLLNSAAHFALNDYGHVTYPSAMLDAQDYRGMRPADLLVDCAVEDQYNFWCDYNEAHGTPELFFMDPNGSGYASSLVVSNVLGEADGVTTFFPYKDARLRRSPSRIAFGVYVTGPFGAWYGRKDVTGQQYAKQDQTTSSSTIKSLDRAKRLANVFLNANDEETDVITFGIKVPIAQVNDIRHGHRLVVKFQHLPGYEDGRWVRVTRRSVVQEEEAGQVYYKIELEAIPSGGVDEDVPDAPWTGAAFAGAQLSQGNFDPLYWEYSGDTPFTGWNSNPTVGPLSYIDDGGGKYTRLTTSRDITVRIHAAAAFAAVWNPGGFARLTCTSSVNGVIYTDTVSFPGGGFGNALPTIDESPYDMVAGEILTFSGTWTGVAGGAGWGNGAVNLTFIRIGRGTFLWMPGSETWVGP